MKQTAPLKLTFQLKSTGKVHTIFLRLNFRLKTHKQIFYKDSDSKVILKYHSCYISTGINAKPEDWNKTTRRLNDGNPDNIRLDNIEKITKDLYIKYANTIEKNSSMRAEYFAEAVKKLVFGKEVPVHKIVIRKDGHNRVEPLDQKQIDFEHKHVYRRYADLTRVQGDSVAILDKLNEEKGANEKRFKLLDTPLYDYVNEVRKQRYERKEISNNTYRQYVNLASFIKAYSEEKNISAAIKNINERWVMDFMNWARGRKQENGEPYSYNYINENLQKLLKSMCNWLNTYDKIDLNISWQIKSLQKSKEKTQEIALTLPQVKKIIDLKLSSKVAHSKIELARDIFVIGCLTGLRVSDLMNLNLEKNADGSYSVNQILQKTGTQVNYVVHNKVVEIWKKYNGKIPSLSEQKLNENIKKLGKLAGFTQLVTFKRKDPSNHKISIDTKPEPFFNFIKSSSCRRTFATFAVHSGVISLDMICRVTGHSKISQLMEYCKVNESELNTNLNKLYEGIKL